jgi:hypothetical protein
MKTTRRGFVGTIVAFVAAASAPKALPSGFARAKPIREQIDFLAMLKDCRALAIAEDIRVDGFRQMIVTYRHDPKAPRTGMDQEAAAKTAGLLPVGVTVTQSCEAIDVTRLGEYRAFETFEAERPVTSVEVVFA